MITREEAIARIAAVLGEADPSRTPTVELNQLADGPADAVLQPSLEARLANAWKAIESDGAAVTTEELARQFPQYATLLRGLTVRSSDAPSTIGGFRILERVGGGGFGIVYKAWDDQLERYVAIKMPRRDKAANLDVELYLKEARFLARLDHAGIVPVHFMDQTPDGQIYVVSKFIEGKDLECALRKGRLGIRESVRLVTSVALALDYAHRHGFVHRDVKPSNIMLGPEGEPVLVDFGLALRTAEFGTGPQWIGTPKYFSPEQARGEGHLVDGRSDIYSLGVVFYELLTGHVPFDVKNTAELLERIRTVEVQPLRQLDAGIPRELERICLKALAKRVAERYLTAGDLATDLQAWDASERGGGIPAERGSSDRGQSPESGGSLAVLPKGLRSYDEADAGFFLQLVPGPRDRQGLPESIRFWKSRIESTDPSNAFRIGVLLGPTGSGKSSLIRAGLIPHLDARHVHIILEESHPHELSTRLLRRLRRLGPMHDPPSSLRESLAYVREAGGLPPDRKLLLVLDQFEQWLAEYPADQTNDLLEGLRQCDGTRVQALLLVRDDFTLATTAFMQQLDEVLHQNRNFAVQSPFGEPHARQVLGHFGRAFGQLPEGPLNGEQASFLQEAVKDLAQDGQLVPIQLAIFAEMVKDKPWRPATLHRSGGTRGVGIAFLQDIVTGPQLRPHLKLVRRVLETLLPEPGQVIKGSPIPRSQLDAAVGPDSQKALDQVLDILDTNLKIVAKVGNASGSSLGSSSRDFELRYQLTHDFLVPTIREWLAIEERSTRRGRARRRLQELASSYKVSQDSRHLPRFGEWLTIRLLTSSWSDAEQALMKRADRRWLTGAVATLSFLAILVFGACEVQRRVAANTLFTELALASPQQLPATINRVVAQRRSLEPRLREERQRLVIGANVDDDPKRWNLSVALACLGDDSELAWLLDRLPRHSPDELLTISELLQRRGPIADRLASRVEAELRASDPQLHVAAMLAQIDPHHACWRTCVEQLARHLATVPVTEAAAWGNLFLPLKEALTPHLLRLWQDPVDLASGERSNLLVLLSGYASNHSAQWATILQHARPEELKGLLEKTGEQREAVRQSLAEPWSVLTSASADQGRDPSDSVVVAAADCLRAYSGACNSSGAFACTIPRDEFDKVDGVLHSHGFRLDVVRPYPEATAVRIAATWRRESIPTRWEWNRSVQEIETLHKQLASDGWQLRDFSRNGSDEGPGAEPRFSVLWIKPPDPVESRIALAIPRDAYLKIRKAWDDDGLSFERYDAWSDQTGNRQYGLIGTREYDNEEVRTFLVDYSLSDFYDPRLDPGVRFPGASQGDCRLSLLPMTLDRFTLTQRIDFRRQEVESELRRQRQDPGKRSKELATAILQLVDILLRAGAHDEAEMWLTKLPENFGEHPTTIVMQATLAARQGRAESVEQAIERYQKTTNKPGLLALLRLRASVLRNDVSGAKQHLEAVQRELPAGVPTTAPSITREILARAYAAAIPLMASHDPEFASHCRRQAISQLKQWYQQGAGTEPDINLQDVEFDGLRGEPEFKELVQTLRIDQKANSVWHELPGYQTRLVTRVSAEDHLQAAIQRLQRGDLPVCVECQISPEDQQLRIMSVWQERLPTPEERARRNRELASLALASASLGDRQRLREVFSDQHGPSARTEAIEMAHRVLSPNVLMSFLRQSDPDEVGLQRSIVLALGGFASPGRSPEEAACREQLEDMARSQADAGLRSAADWCLRRWGSSIAAVEGKGAGASQRPWTTDSLGRRMIRVARKTPFLMGAAPGEPGKGGSEMRHWARIDHDFWLAESEVTIKDFQAYLNDSRIQEFYGDEPPTFTRRFAPTDDCPIISLSIEDAARFCQWLSEKEELPPSEWCYPNLLSNDQPFVRPLDYLQRTGYRLPTEMEWELACRAGSDTSRFYGESSTCLTSYAWYAANAQGRVHPVKSLRPNDWGFFDMLGNAREWCFDVDAPYHLPFDGIVRTLSPTELPRDFRAESFPARGGSLVSDTGELRAASRKFAPPRQHAVSLGFRYARTYRTSRTESPSATSN